MNAKTSLQPWQKSILFWLSFLALMGIKSIAPVFPITLIVGINESNFQHYKAAFYAYLLASLVEYLILRRRVGNRSTFGYARLTAALLVPWLVFLVWYIGPALSGRLPAIWLEIVYANLVALLAGWLAAIFEGGFGQITYGKPLKAAVLSLAIVSILLYTIFTFKLPWADVFVEPDWRGTSHLLGGSILAFWPGKRVLKKRIGVRTGTMMAWLLGLLSLAGVGIILYATTWGAGLMDDAFIYLTSAKNLAVGNGLVWPWGEGELLPLTYFPPLFPLLLSGFVRLGVDAWPAARVLNAIAFGASIFLVGLIGRTAARSSPRLNWGFGLLSALLFLTSDVLIEAHSWAMSEALYIILALLGILLMARALDPGKSSPTRSVDLIAPALVFGLGFLTRYIGLSLILTGLGGILLFKRTSWAGRFWSGVLFGFVSLLPMAGWMARSLLVTGSPIDRSPGLHLVTWKQLVKGLNTVLTWFFPGRIVTGNEVLIAGLVLLGLLAVSLILHNSHQKTFGASSTLDGSKVIRWLLALQVIFHAVVLLISKSFFEPTTPLNDRILSPMLPSLLCLFAAFLSDLWGAGRSRLLHRYARLISSAAVVAIALLFVGFYSVRAATLVPRLHSTGLGLARKVWHSSETLSAVRALPAVPLFSNSPAGIYLWAGRTAYPIYNLTLMNERMQADGAMLALFNSISTDLYDVTREELTESLVPVATFDDGVIYAAEENPFLLEGALP